MKMVFWAGVGTLFPFLMTTLGAALVFLMKKQSEDGPCMGFAAGVMSAAAVFSMLLPAMRQKAGGWLTVTLGFALGAAMIAGVDAFLGRTQRLQGVSASAKPVTIRIGAREEYGRLVLTVSDNGPGLPANHSGGFGIGLANVRDRLAARFDWRRAFSSSALRDGS